MAFTFKQKPVGEKMIKNGFKDFHLITYLLITLTSSISGKPWAEINLI